jgi:capsular polysaccharide biosynthesis protein
MAIDTKQENEVIIGGVDIDIFKYDLRILLITIRRRFYLLIIFPILTSLLAYGYVSYVKKKTWTARCMMFRHTNMERLQSDMPNVYKPIETKVVMEMIRTRKNMREIIKRLNMKTSISGLYGRTVVEVQEDNQDIINIIASASTPAEAANIANTLAEVFIDEYVQTQNGSIQKIYDYFSDSKVSILEKIKSLEDQKDEYLKKYKIISITSESEGKFKQLNELELQYIQAKMLESSLKIKLAHLSDNIKDMKDEIQLSYTVSATSTAEVEKLQTQLYKLRQRYTDENPRVQKLMSEIEFIKQKTKSNQDTPKAPDRVTYGGNRAKSSLEDQRMRTEAELSALTQSMKHFDTAIAKLRSELGQLSQVENEYLEIRRQLELNRELLKKVDNSIVTMKFAIKSNVSDIAIMERAEPPASPSTKKRRIIVLIGGFVGFVIAFLIIMLSELINFTIKSRFDIENVLKIKMLGSLPVISQVKLQTFYSAIQVIYKRIAEAAESGKDKVPFIAVGDVEGKTGKTFIIRKIIDLFDPKDKRILYISTTEEVSKNLAKFVINDFIYKDEKFDPEFAAENSHRLYFLLDDFTYIAPADTGMFKKFIDKMREKYDYIYWELFDFNKNEQLFACICEVATLTVVMTRFKRSDKFKLLKCVSFLKEHNCERIGGVLNSVDNVYYDKA